VTQSIEQRLSHLEASSYRFERDLPAIHGRIEHLSGAIGELSQDLRALRHEVQTEVVPRLDAIDARLDRMERAQSEQGQLLADQGQLLRAIVAHLGIGENE